MPRRFLNLHGSMSFLPTGVGVFLAAASMSGFAQEVISPSSEVRRTLSIVPRLSVSETLTNNVSLTSVGRQSEQITEISPGIQIVSDGGRLKGFLDYSLRQVMYAQNSSGRSSRNALNTFGTFEAVDHWAYLDFSGNIAQQAISAFGAQSPSGLSSNSNLTESRSFRLSPYLRGKLSTFADYEARYSLNTSRSQSSLASDVTTNEAVVRLNGQTPSARLGWSMDASRQNTRFGAGRTTEADTLRGNLNYSVNPQLNLTFTGGREANNYTTINKNSSFISGFGLNWNPSETTKLAGSRQNRSFGSSHSVLFEHRTARTVWRFNDSKDVSASPNQTGFASLGSVYELYFSQFASVEPDPIRRAALVNNFLQVNGINPNATAVGSFLTSALSLQRRQDLSFALLGQRDTITFIANRSEGLRLDTVVGGVNDDLSNSAAVRQRGLSVNLAHRLTPETSLTVVASLQKATDAQGLQNTSTKSVNVNVATRVGTHSTAILGARRVVFESLSAPYTESAITGTLNIQF